MQRMSFIDAIRCDNKNLVKLFIKNGVNVNKIRRSRGEIGSVIKFAILENADEKIIEILLKAGANLCYKIEYYLFNALVLLRYNKAIDLILTQYNPNNINYVLIWAVRYGNVGYIQQLLTKGADINFLDDNETTPLINAVVYKQIDVIKFLLKNGAEINKLAHYGAPAVFYAASLFDLGLTKFLVSYGANLLILSPVNKGDNIIHFVLRQSLLITVPDFCNQYREAIKIGVDGSIELFEFLINNGVDPLKKDFYDQYPMVYAVIHSYKLLNLLISAGADVEKNGPVNLLKAINYDNEEVARFLFSKKISLISTDYVKFVTDQSGHPRITKYQKMLKWYGWFRDVLLAREFDPNSLFYRDYLPWDMFREILKDEICLVFGK